MKAEQLRKSILQMAIQGKLVPQDPTDEPASVLLEKIRVEKQRLIKEGKIKKDKVDSIIFKGEDNRHYEKVGNDVKDITAEIDFDLPDGWEYIRLSTICWLEDIKATSGEKLPYLDAKTLRGKSDKNYVLSGKVVENGTKIILVDGENSGEVFDVPFRGYMGSTFKILGASNNVNIQYLNIVLDFYKDVFKGNKIGAAIPHLNKNLFRSLLIGLPPVSEQSRIVSKLIEYKPSITKYGQLEQEKSKLDGEIFEKLKKSILQYAIQGKLVPQDENDEPASELLKRIRAEKKAKLGKKYVDSYIYKGDDNCYYEHIDGKAKDEAIEVPYDLPENWMWSRVQGISESYIGLTYKPSDVIKENGSIVLRSSNIQDGKLDLTDIVRVSSQITDKLRVVKNDIIICARNGSKKLVGKSALVDVDLPNLTFGAFMAICKTSLYAYAYIFLQSNLFFSQLEKVSGTTTINQLTQASFNSFLVPIPPLAEQQRIVDKINEIFSKL